MTPEKRNRLVQTAVLAQPEYTVHHCAIESYFPDYSDGIPMSGTWVFPAVLGRRDLLLKW